MEDIDIPTMRQLKKEVTNNNPNEVLNMLKGVSKHSQKLERRSFYNSFCGRIEIITLAIKTFSSYDKNAIEVFREMVNIFEQSGETLALNAHDNKKRYNLLEYAIYQRKGRFAHIILDAIEGDEKAQKSVLSGVALRKSLSANSKAFAVSRKIIKIMAEYKKGRKIFYNNFDLAIKNKPSIALDMVNVIYNNSDKKGRAKLLNYPDINEKLKLFLESKIKKLLCNKNSERNQKEIKSLILQGIVLLERMVYLVANHKTKAVDNNSRLGSFFKIALFAMKDICYNYDAEHKTYINKGL